MTAKQHVTDDGLTTHESAPNQGCSIYTYILKSFLGHHWNNFFKVLSQAFDTLIMRRLQGKDVYFRCWLCTSSIINVSKAWDNTLKKLFQWCPKNDFKWYSAETSSISRDIHIYIFIYFLGDFIFRKTKCEKVQNWNKDNSNFKDCSLY